MFTVSNNFVFTKTTLLGKWNLFGFTEKECSEVESTSEFASASEDEFGSCLFGKCDWMRKNGNCHAGPCVTVVRHNL